MSRIPIKNIYYLLSYAWNKLHEQGKIRISVEGLTSQQDLFARILISGTTTLLKQGLLRTYSTVSDEVYGVKGKLNLDQTLKSALHLRQRTYCTFDVNSSNVLANQVLFSTINRLAQTEELNGNLRNELRELIKWFPSEIKNIKLTQQDFNRIGRVRKSGLYDFLLNICHLSYVNMLPTERPGRWKFKDFTRDEKQLNQLFEAFVRRFYQVKLSHQFSVGSTIIKWQMMGSEVDKQLLPQMRSDITLENSERKIIIDTKFYGKTMSTNFEREKIHSTNLYQLFAYLLNQEDGSEKCFNTQGILLYPVVQNEYDLQYKYRKHFISIKMVDLQNDWMRIEQQLLNIITNETESLTALS